MDECFACRDMPGIRFLNLLLFGATDSDKFSCAKFVIVMPIEGTSNVLYFFVSRIINALFLSVPIQRYTSAGLMCKRFNFLHSARYNHSCSIYLPSISSRYGLICV